MHLVQAASGDSGGQDAGHDQIGFVFEKATQLKNFADLRVLYFMELLEGVTTGPSRVTKDGYSQAFKALNAKQKKTFARWSIRSRASPARSR